MPGPRAPEGRQQRRLTESPAAGAREVPEMDGEVEGERHVNGNRRDPAELARGRGAHQGVEGELVELDEGEEEHGAGHLPEGHLVATVQVERDAPLTELGVHEGEDVGRGAHRKDVAIGYAHVEPGHRLLHDERVDQEIEDGVGQEQQQVPPPPGPGQRVDDSPGRDAPEQEREDGERDRPRGGAPRELQADGSSFSNCRMSSSAKRSRT